MVDQPPRCAAALVEPLVAHLLAEMPERRAWEREFPRGDPAARRYADFLDRTEKARTLFLDLGSGWNTPGIFKVPFWRMTLRRPEARYACVNLEPDQLPAELGDRAVHVASAIGAALARLA